MYELAMNVENIFWNPKCICSTALFSTFFNIQIRNFDFFFAICVHFYFGRKCSQIADVSYSNQSTGVESRKYFSLSKMYMLKVNFCYLQSTKVEISKSGLVLPE